MCSIFGVFNLAQGQDLERLRETALRQSRLQRHRGPDWSGSYTHPNAVLAHERLAIVDVMTGAQPLLNPAGSHALAVNGEIYNHRRLREQLGDFEFQTNSDCEVILALHATRPDEPSAWLDELEGMFAFALYDADANRYLIARDHIGIMPLYLGYDEDGQLFVASEMKALMDVCSTVEIFPPGHYLDSTVGELRAYYQRPWQQLATLPRSPMRPSDIRQALEQSVKSHLMTDVPYGVLLSGGLDSSVISALVQKHAGRRVEDHELSQAWWPRLHSFSIGLPGSPDLLAAQKVADHLGTVHHGFEFTLQEGLDAIEEVIYHLETYDVTTIRASTPMYLMARKIRAMGIKMVLSGEGADEVFGGYLYFHKAPDADEFHQETVRKLDRLHLFDCLRANKAMAAWGVEARVPFLDKRFLDTAMNMDPAQKMIGGDQIEKHILREAFQGYLPDEILWRQKEQFSDGVGYSWIDGIRDHAAAQITDDKLAHAARRFPVNTPTTKEAYLFRRIFERHFPLAAAADTVPWGKSVACSSPEAMAWDKSFEEMIDPSGRAIAGVHDASY